MTLTYHQEGDYLIPELDMPQETKPAQAEAEELTKYGLMRKKFLSEHCPGIYTAMLAEGTLWSHCLEIQHQAQERMDILTTQMAQTEGVTEALKSEDPMSWVRRMNSIKYRAEEIILTELINN